MFSLCKGCAKDAVFFCIRGNKGLCETCMETIKLIEREEQEKKEPVCLIEYTFSFFFLVDFFFFCDYLLIKLIKYRMNLLLPFLSSNILWTKHRKLDDTY